MFDGGMEIEVGGELITAARDEVWTELHRALKSIGTKRAVLDASELSLLREAEEIGLYRRRGHPTMAAYMVAELECSRHTANEKLRVAGELIDLPEIALAFRGGELGWTKVRELTRVATAETEGDWLEAIEGRSSGEVQQMVKGVCRGARPGDRPDPAIVEEWVGLRVPATIAAMWRQMRGALDAEARRRLGDAEIAERLCKLALMPEADGGHTPPAFQIAITTCRHCKIAAQVGPGVDTEISGAALERALCDAVIIGDLEDDEPQRVQWTIPANTRRKVAVRDRFTCCYPRCTSTRFLEAHHIVHREHGGDHAMSRICLLCDGHHAAHHDGLIRISGTAPDGLVFEQLVDVEARRYDRVR